VGQGSTHLQVTTSHSSDLPTRLPRGILLPCLASRRTVSQWDSLSLLARADNDNINKNSKSHDSVIGDLILGCDYEVYVALTPRLRGDSRSFRLDHLHN
jgi:hypothetical protein